MLYQSVQRIVTQCEEQNEKEIQLLMAQKLGLPPAIVDKWNFHFPPLCLHSGGWKNSKMTTRKGCSDCPFHAILLHWLTIFKVFEQCFLWLQNPWRPPHQLQLPTRILGIFWSSKRANFEFSSPVFLLTNS